MIDASNWAKDLSRLFFFVGCIPRSIGTPYDHHPSPTTLKIQPADLLSMHASPLSHGFRRFREDFFTCGVSWIGFGNRVVPKRKKRWYGSLDLERGWWWHVPNAAGKNRKRRAELPAASTPIFLSFSFPPLPGPASYGKSLAWSSPSSELALVCSQVYKRATQIQIVVRKVAILAS
jgi:hypothetical protein